MATARVTSTGAIIELAPGASVRVTSTGAVLEIAPAQRVQVTSVGAYVESFGGLWPWQRMRHGKGFRAGALLPYNSEDR